MKAISKFITGAAAAALVTISAASPAQARHWDRHDGIDTGDVIAGVAIIGGIAAIASALSRDGDRYGYGYRDRYRDGYQNAVNACGYEAERFGRGRVQILDVDRRGSNSYRVRGVIEAGGYDTRYERYGRDYDRGYNRGYERYDRYDQRSEFRCTARSNGRVTDFDVDRYRY